MQTYQQFLKSFPEPLEFPKQLKLASTTYILWGRGNNSIWNSISVGKNSIFVVMSDKQMKQRSQKENFSLIIKLLKFIILKICVA